MLSRKWKAFVRLNGETMIDNDRDFVNEFTGFAKQLEQIGVEYSIIVSVEKGPIRQFSRKASRFQPIVSSAGATGRQPLSEGD